MFKARSPRHPSQYRTALVTAQLSIPAIVLNASQTGCLFRVDGPLRRGQRIAFTLLGERIFATVVRDNVGRAAVRFGQPLNRLQLDALRLGSGHGNVPAHVHADRTTALRVMSRMVRGIRRQSDHGRAHPG